MQVACRWIKSSLNEGNLIMPFDKRDYRQEYTFDEMETALLHISGLKDHWQFQERYSDI